MAQRHRDDPSTLPPMPPLVNGKSLLAFPLRPAPSGRYHRPRGDFVGSSGPLFQEATMRRLVVVGTVFLVVGFVAGRLWQHVPVNAEA